MEWPIRYVRCSSTLYSLRTISRTFRTSFSLNSRRFGGSLATSGFGRRGRSRRWLQQRTSIPSARVIAHRSGQNVAAFFGQIDGVAAHQRILIASQSMQSNDQRIFLVLRYFRRHINGVGDLFVRVREMIAVERADRATEESGPAREHRQVRLAGRNFAQKQSARTPGPRPVEPSRFQRCVLPDLESLAAHETRRIIRAPFSLAAGGRQRLRRLAVFHPGT